MILRSAITLLELYDRPMSIGDVDGSTFAVDTKRGGDKEKGDK